MLITIRPSCQERSLMLMIEVRIPENCFFNDSIIRRDVWVFYPETRGLWYLQDVPHGESLQFGPLTYLKNEAPWCNGWCSYNMKIKWITCEDQITRGGRMMATTSGTESSRKNKTFDPFMFDKYFFLTFVLLFFVMLFLPLVAFVLLR